MGALLSGRFDERWIVATRRWTLLAWTALGIGILLGAKWAYEEVGWGGYYAWDPVENAALMPWLASTAFLHSVMVQEKKNMLRVWNVVLVSLAFCLSLFGTFLTRSGVISSIHSFTQSSIGPWLLGFIAVVAAFSTALIFWRLPLLRTKTRLESLASREAAFLYNNLLLVALTLTVLWGVAFPLLSELVRGEKITVGPPYFDFFLRVLGLPLLLLMGIGPLVAWRRTSLRALRREPRSGRRCSRSPAGSRWSRSAPARASPASSRTPSARSCSRRSRSSSSAGPGRGEALDRSSWPAAFSSLVGRNRRRYGGYIVHAAIVLLALGIAGGAYGSTKVQKLEPRPDDDGSAATTCATSARSCATSRTAPRSAPASPSRAAATSLGTYLAGKNSYPVEDQVSNEVGIRTDWLRAQDLFLIGDQFNNDGSVVVKALVNPLVDLIWLAGFVFLLGSLIAMWPDEREQRRLARRGAPVPAT